jgi:hypothetical protein
MANKLSESSEFTIPLKNLLALVGATAVSVWAYFGIIERLTFLEHDTSMMLIEIEENDNWIDEWKPPASVQENIKKVRELDKELVKVKLELEYLKSMVYK